MNHNFLRIARESEDRWWTYPLVLFLAIFVLSAIAVILGFLGVFIAVIVGAIAGNPDVAIGEFFANFEFDRPTNSPWKLSGGCPMPSRFPPPPSSRSPSGYFSWAISPNG